MEFCVFTYGLRGKTIREWDARLMHVPDRRDGAEPDLPEEWLENAVPILCRFLSSMEAAGRLQNAAELIADQRGGTRLPGRGHEPRSIATFPVVSSSGRSTQGSTRRMSVP